MCDVVSKNWGAWENVGVVVTHNSDWTLKDVDLTANAGEKVRFAFLHVDNYSYRSTGWYIDDIQIIAKVPDGDGFDPEDFEDEPTAQ